MKRPPGSPIVKKKLMASLWLSNVNSSYMSCERGFLSAQGTVRHSCLYATYYSYAGTIVNKQKPIGFCYPLGLVWNNDQPTPWSVLTQSIEYAIRAFGRARTGGKHTLVIMALKASF